MEASAREETMNRGGPGPAGRLTGEAPRVGARPDRRGKVTGVAGMRGSGAHSFQLPCFSKSGIHQQ